MDRSQKIKELEKDCAYWQEKYFYVVEENCDLKEQIKELKEIVAEENNDLQKARPNILAKLKEFGVDILSNVVANILTNPTIWTQL